MKSISRSLKSVGPNATRVGYHLEGEIRELKPEREEDVIRLVYVPALISLPGQPRRRPFLPLIVGQLLDACAVVSHDENLAVGLWAVGIQRFILEPHPR